MKFFSPSWKSSKQKRKQRKYQKNAPLHIKQKFIAANLSKDLRKKYGRRALTLRKGYRIKILRGQFKKQTGKIAEVRMKETAVHVEGIQRIKRDGTKVFVSLHPSNLQIIEFAPEDKRLRARLERKEKE